MQPFTRAAEFRDPDRGHQEGKQMQNEHGEKLLQMHEMQMAAVR